ncbi:MAG: hypothetical protein LQ337_008729 [Flavoplaca oasis]|nr:MAG: hypothetical protein LQ337_008729 [Flavoplaca oasis]
MRDTNDITPQPQSLITCGNNTNSPESRTLQRPRQLEQADAKRRRKFLTLYGRSVMVMALNFEPLPKKSDKNSFGDLLAYLSSPIEKNKFQMNPRGRFLHWRVQLKDATDAYGNQGFMRFERIIMHTFRLQRRTAYPGRDSCLMYNQFQWLEANEVQAAEHIGRWLQWMDSKPYDKEGILTDPWKRRIRYFTSHQHKLGLLAESSPFEVWSMFLDPTWWLRLRTSYYGMILRQIVNSPYMLSSVRTQLRLKYDASSYGRDRKSSRLRKSIRAEVETAMPQTWNVQAVYGHR